MSLRLRSLVTALILAAVLCSATVACTPSQPETGGRSGESTTTRLAPNEVREYRGERLDSVDDMRENSIKGPQSVDIASYRLQVLGKVDKRLSLTYEQVLARKQYEKVVRLDCVEGWSVNILWRGVLLSDLLEQAGYKRDAKTVIFRCKDGYSTSLPLDYVVRRQILLAGEMNGVKLPKERGYPFQVVAEDKWGYKWAKWVTSIEVSDNAGYRGYWEQRGYDNGADLPGAK